MTTMKLCDMVKDFTHYPRTAVSGTHVNSMVDALAAGKSLPRLKVCRASKRIVGGFHRHAALEKHLGPDAEVEVEFCDFKTEGEFFLACVEDNAGHGRPYSPFDRLRCLTRAKELRLPVAKLADALRMTAARAKAMLEDRTATGPGRGDTRPLKNTIRHMAGQPLTESQSKANDKLGGSSTAFYAHQLIILMENELMPPADDKLAATMRRLHGLVGEWLGANVAA